MPVFILPFPAIDPVAISVGPFIVRWYALAYIFGFFACWAYASAR
jgi:phosphatidylglycerol:prolipoprotein diacylglycerol transferase